MSTSVRHDGQNTDRGWTQKLWQACKVRAIKDNPTFGIGYETDFTHKGDIGEWEVDTATAGTFALISNNGTGNHLFGGIAALDSASSTVVQGVQIQLCEAGGVAGEQFIPQANSDIFFECRFMVADMTAGSTGPETFLGLCENDATIIGSSALSTANHLGLSSITDDGVLIDVAEKAGAAASGSTRLSLATAATPGAALWHKFGMHIKGVTTVDYYTDGVKTKDVNATANIPIVALSPAFVCQSDGTVDPILYLDWVRCYQQLQIA